MLKGYLRYFNNWLYSFIVSKGFNTFGKNSYIRPCADMIVGKSYISIGYNVVMGKHIQLTAWASNECEKKAPQIVIGSDSQIGSYNHITAINKIEIGNGVLTGKFVTITDNSHGNPGNLSDCDITPIKRKVFSKGPVVIEDNVWIGDKATILPNVRLGRCSIVGANSVVTKDVPPYTVVAGNPAKIIKIIK